MREQNTKLVTLGLIVMLVLLDRDWGVEADSPRQKFSVTSVGVIFNQWGV